MSKNKITILTIKPILTKEEIKEKEGEYFDESHYTKHNKVITADTDVYGLEEDGTKKLLLKSGILIFSNIVGYSETQ